MALVSLLHFLYLCSLVGQWERQVDDKGVFKQGDILDEALEYFKANVLFRTFDVKGSADILLIYSTLYISQCLAKLKGRGKQDAQKQLFALAVENFALPGDGGFPLGGMVAAPSSRADAGMMALSIALP